MRALLAVVALAGAAVASDGRSAARPLLVSFGWLELIDATTYLNHYWFVTLLAAAGHGRTARVDLEPRRPAPQPRSHRGWIWLLRFQVGIVYASAGLAKLHTDWLVRALPLRLWLPARADLPLVGGLLEWTATAAAVAGRSSTARWCRCCCGGGRPWAWAVLVVFHVSTWVLFPIGVFPWLMIGVSTVFFDPAPPRRRALAGRRPRRSPGPPGASAAAVRRWPSQVRSAGWRCSGPAPAPPGLPVDHRWTGEGYRFGWNVLLVERSGSVTFVVHEPTTGRTWTADLEALYTRPQIRVMSGEPDLILQAARAIAAAEADRGHARWRCAADAWLSFNGSPCGALDRPDGGPGGGVALARPEGLDPAGALRSPGPLSPRAGGGGRRPAPAPAGARRGRRW